MSNQDNKNIFENKEETPQNDTDLSKIGGASSDSDPFADLLGSIRNERGEVKYKNTVEALNGLKHAQEFIPQLKGELSKRDKELEEMRNEIEKLRAVEETVQKLSAVRKQDEEVNTKQPQVSEEQIADIVSRTLTRKEQEALSKSNLTKVVSTLQSSLGTDAEKKFYGKAEELGMTVEQINSMAATSPKAVLALFGITSNQPKEEGVFPTQGSLNTTGIEPKRDSYIGRNQKNTLLGATTAELAEERVNANKLVEELEANGLSIDDLSKPSNYFKFFK